jgi:urease accessory protein
MIMERLNPEDPFEANQRRKMSMVPNRIVATSLLLFACTGPALAHTGAGPVHGFSAGLTHPVFGADHLLAMIAVGLWAALAAPRLFWVAPAGFLGGMLGGGVAGIAGLGMPGVELMIGGSVILFGVLALLKLQTPAILAFAAAAVFGAAHGFAHGAEMPAGSGMLDYAAGFLIATAFLHAIGASFGFLAKHLDLARVGQAAGGAVAAAGVALMIV